MRILSSLPPPLLCGGSPTELMGLMGALMLQCDPSPLAWGHLAQATALDCLPQNELHWRSGESPCIQLFSSQTWRVKLGAVGCLDITKSTGSFSEKRRMTGVNRGEPRRIVSAADIGVLGPAQLHSCSSFISQPQSFMTNVPFC